MVEQNNNDNTKNDEAPKRRSRLFGGRRARSADLEARGGVEQSAPVEQAAGTSAAACPRAMTAPAHPTISGVER